jgi:hypothetical protein
VVTVIKFNLNAMFDDDIAFTGRRGPLVFEAGAGILFDEISAHGEEEAPSEDGEDGEEMKMTMARKGRRKTRKGVKTKGGIDVADKKKKKKVATGTRGLKWKDMEDQCLCYCWKTVSINVITGAYQKYDAYWVKIKADFDERK